jgi:CheY-like chemotaxis protein
MSQESMIRVLCVDDEPRVLEGLERNLGDQFEIVTADGGETGIAAITATPDFDVVISDMRMPNMNGAVFLGHARRLAPDAQRVLLTGEADAESARAAVNEGQIFRYLVKPCPVDELARVIEAGAATKRRTIADREMLETTVAGSVKLLGEVLALAAPACFRETPGVTSIVEHLCERLGLHETWKFRAAAMLHTIGYVALPIALIEKRRSGVALLGAEKRELASATDIGARLLSSIPRFSEVAEIVRRHRETPPAELTDDVTRGAAMLHVALLVLEDATATRRVAQIAKSIAPQHGEGARSLLALLHDYQAKREQESVVAVKIAELRPGMVLEENLVSRTGNVLFASGNELTAPLLERVRQFHRSAPLAEPIKVRLAS